MIILWLCWSQGYFKANIGGFYDNGVVLSAIANRPDQTEGCAICGFIDGLTASKYTGRDAAALYVENNNTTPILAKGAVFNGNKVILLTADLFKKALVTCLRTVPRQCYIRGIAFFTDKSLPESDTEGIAIFYKGNDVWVDVLGRIIR